MPTFINIKLSGKCTDPAAFLHAMIKKDYPNEHEVLLHEAKMLLLDVRKDMEKEYGLKVSLSMAIRRVVECTERNIKDKSESTVLIALYQLAHYYLDIEELEHGDEVHKP